MLPRANTRGLRRPNRARARSCGRRTTLGCERRRRSGLLWACEECLEMMGVPPGAKRTMTRRGWLCNGAHGARTRKGWICKGACGAKDTATRRGWLCKWSARHQRSKAMQRLAPGGERRTCIPNFRRAGNKLSLPFRFFSIATIFASTTTKL